MGWGWRCQASRIGARLRLDIALQNYDMEVGRCLVKSATMHVGLARQEEVDRLIAVHGADAIGSLVRRIADAVCMCDDHTVRELDHLLQLVETRLEGSWRAPESESASSGARTGVPWSRAGAGLSR